MAIIRVLSRVLKNNVSQRLTNVLHTRCTGQKVGFVLDTGMISIVPSATRTSSLVRIGCRATSNPNSIITRQLLVDIKHHPMVGNFKLRGLNLREARHKGIFIGKRVRASIPKMCTYNSLAKCSLLTRATIHRTRMTVRSVVNGGSTVDCHTVPNIMCAGPRVTNINRARRSLRGENITCHTIGLPVTCDNHFMTRGRKIGNIYGLLLNDSSAMLKTRILNGPTSRVVALTNVTVRLGLATSR